METNEIIKELRKSYGLTQTDLGNVLNCDRFRIADIERGKTQPNIQDIKKLSQHFNVSADYLLGLREYPTKNEDIQMICDYTGLSEDSVKELNNTFGSNANIEVFAEDIGNLLFSPERYALERLSEQKSTENYKEIFVDCKDLFNNIFPWLIDGGFLYYKYLFLMKKRYNDFYEDIKAGLIADISLERDSKLTLFEIQEHFIRLANTIVEDYEIPLKEWRKQFLPNCSTEEDTNADD